MAKYRTCRLDGLSSWNTTYDVQIKYKWWPWWITIACGFLHGDSAVSYAHDHAAKRRNKNPTINNLGEL